MSNCGGCDEITLPLGQDGVDGKNAFTITSSSFTQPLPGSSVSINVSTLGQFSNAWAISGQIIFIADSSGNGGYYQVVSTTGNDSITITNLGYASNSSDGLPILSGASVSPSGPIGATGPAGQNGGNGNPGSQGPAGTPGSKLLVSSTGGVVTTSSFISVWGAFSLGNGLLVFPQDNDKIVINALFYNNQGSGKGLIANFYVVLIGANINTVSSYFYNPANTNLVLSPGRSSNVSIEVYRVNQFAIRYTVTYTDSNGQTSSWGTATALTEDLNNPINIQILGKLSSNALSGEDAGCVQASVTSYKQ
jgi:hypothetical protein